MPFGLEISSTTFQSARVVINLSVKGHFALEYLKDIVVFCKTVHEHPTNFRRVLTLLQNAGVTLKINLILLLQIINYLGHVLLLVRLKIAEKCRTRFVNYKRLQLRRDRDPFRDCTTYSFGLYPTSRIWRHQSIREHGRTNRSSFLNYEYKIKNLSTTWIQTSRPVLALPGQKAVLHLK